VRRAADGDAPRRTNTRPEKLDVHGSSPAISAGAVFGPLLRETKKARRGNSAASVETTKIDAPGKGPWDSQVHRRPRVQDEQKSRKRGGSRARSSSPIRMPTKRTPHTRTDRRAMIDPDHRREGTNQLSSGETSNHQSRSDTKPARRRLPEAKVRVTSNRWEEGAFERPAAQGKLNKGRDFRDQSVVRSRAGNGAAQEPGVKKAPKIG